jgi:hypothetical protein
MTADPDDIYGFHNDENRYMYVDTPCLSQHLYCIYVAQMEGRLHVRRRTSPLSNFPIIHIASREDRSFG